MNLVFILGLGMISVFCHFVRAMIKGSLEENITRYEKCTVHKTESECVCLCAWRDGFCIGSGGILGTSLSSIY